MAGHFVRLKSHVSRDSDIVPIQLLFHSAKIAHFFAPQNVLEDEATQRNSSRTGSSCRCDCAEMGGEIKVAFKRFNFHYGGQISLVAICSL